MRDYTCSEGRDGAWQITKKRSVVESDSGADNEVDACYSSYVLGNRALESTRQRAIVQDSGKTSGFGSSLLDWRQSRRGHLQVGMVLLGTAMINMKNPYANPLCSANNVSRLAAGPATLRTPIDADCPSAGAFDCLSAEAHDSQLLTSASVTQTTTTPTVTNPYFPYQ